MTISDSAVPGNAPVAPDSRRSFAIYRFAGKRAFDIAFALLILPVVLPVIAVLWAVVSRDGGSGIFGHKRVGRDGRVFRCWKIRTMVVDAEMVLRDHLAAHPEAAAEWARDHKLTDDPRITRLGHFLRRTSLDELPQIFNVLAGDMSFVGPRPVVRYELHKYGQHRAVYKSMKPGITGLWQVSGRNDVSYFERVQLDLKYAGAISLLSDVRLILLTGFSVMGGTGR